MTPLQLGLGLGGQLLGGLLGNSAARAQRRAAEQQQALLSQQYGQARGDLMPYMQAGGNALGRMAAVEGGDYSAFENAPDYQYARDQSLRALDRSAAARGSLYSGGTDADRLEMASGLASQNLNNYLGRQMGLAGMGQNAATSLGSLGLQSAGAQANAIGAQGQARANGFGSWMDALNGSGALVGNFLGAKSAGGVWGSAGRPDIQVSPLARMQMPVPRFGG